MRRGEVWWASLPAPVGSEPGYRRPVLVIQADAFNRSRLRTVIVAAITSNTTRAEMPGNVLLSRKASGLPRKSVVNVSHILTLDRSFLVKRIRSLPGQTLARVEAGVRLALSL